MARHADGDQPKTAPGVEQSVDDDELGLVGTHAHSSERGEKECAATVGHLTSHSAGLSAAHTPATTPPSRWPVRQGAGFARGPREDLPLAVVVGEPIADAELVREDRERRLPT